MALQARGCRQGGAGRGVQAGGCRQGGAGRGGRAGKGVQKSVGNGKKLQSSGCKQQGASNTLADNQILLLLINSGLGRVLGILIVCETSDANFV